MFPAFSWGTIAPMSFNPCMWSVFRLNKQGKGKSQSSLTCWCVDLRRHSRSSYKHLLTPIRIIWLSLLISSLLQSLSQNDRESEEKRQWLSHHLMTNHHQAQLLAFSWWPHSIHKSCFTKQSRHHHYISTTFLQVFVLCICCCCCCCQFHSEYQYKLPMDLVWTYDDLICCTLSSVSAFKQNPHVGTLDQT